jgi:hypothetical protein
MVWPLQQHWCKRAISDGEIQFLAETWPVPSYCLATS